jgi:translation initiation factor 5A
MSDNEFQATQGGSTTYPAQAGSLKKGDYIVIDDKPCKIMELTTAKTGKHGHAKASITAIDIFTGKKYEMSTPTSHNVDCPNVVKTEYELVSIDDNGFCTFIAEDGEYREDLKLPSENDNDFIKPLKEAYEKGANILLSVVAALGEEHITSYREDKK